MDYESTNQWAINVHLLLITQPSSLALLSWLKRCICLRLTLAVLSVRIFLLPSITSHKGNWNVHISLQQMFPSIYIIRCKMCVKSFERGGSPSSEPGLQLPSSELHCSVSRWSGLRDRASFFFSWSPSRSVTSHVSVCRFSRCICSFELKRSGYPTASQHCSHNQRRHPKIC